MTTTATTTIPVTINGRMYDLHLDGKTANAGNEFATRMYRITGQRNADGALLIRTDGQYAGRPLILGISALERLNWWDIKQAIAGLVPEVPVEA